ncbi:MAG: tetratricopeptide repeat protein [Caldilineaceae bacterium]|nr:tetratricopeptide repeat protein [Caldilineaceae bacterium]
MEALRLTEKTLDLGAIEPVREEVIPLLQKISDHTALPANPQQMQRGQQSALTVKRDSGPSIIHSTAGSLVHWASFAFIFFLLLKFNMVTATPSVLHQWLGDYHLRMEQPEQALTEYDIAIDILPNNTAAQLGRGYAYAAIGKAAYDKGEYTAAIAALDAALATPLVAEKPYLVYLYRGAAYAQLYNFDTALSDYQLAMSEMVSVDPRIYISIGSAHAGNGDYAAALFAYNQAIDELGETQLAPYYYRGIVYMALKEYEAAMADFNFLIAQNYDVPQIYFLRFLLQYRAGNVEAGDQDLRHVFASKDRPDMRTMGQLLGQLYTGAEAQVNTRWHSFNHPTTAPPAPVQNTPDPTRLPSLVAMAAQYGLVLAVAD